VTDGLSQGRVNDFFLLFPERERKEGSAAALVSLSRHEGGRGHDLFQSFAGEGKRGKGSLPKFPSLFCAQ